MAYSKPWLSHREQLNQLQQRGMTVTDEEAALDYLERIGYYRLSGYWYPFRERSGEVVLLSEQGRKPQKVRTTRLVMEGFKPGSRFIDAVELYVFDKRLRLLTMDALERIEIAIRVDISHTLGHLDPFAYLKPEYLFTDFCQKLDSKTGLSEHHAWLASHARLIGRSKEEFVKHNKNRYGLPLPIWVACEVWDFGTMSMLYAGMRPEEQDQIASTYGITNGRVFASWLRSLNYLRNVCAHHSRLWNRNIADQPKLPSSSAIPWIAEYEHNEHALARCFLLLRICRHLLIHINPNSTWPQRMREHLEEFPDLEHLGLNVAGMGAPANWLESW
ncbi:abortive phage resistance protein [Aeromonas sp. ANP5]|nr:abortive phage resistance protein [Aeromonas sp. ANNP30]OEC66713.1 abortive phage resistance protein [Aeromonas sp. ANP5]